MGLDSKNKYLIQISAAIVSNALVTLRGIVKEALESGISEEEIIETFELAREIQNQPNKHTDHLVHQLLREEKKGKRTSVHIHSDSCGCGHHN